MTRSMAAAALAVLTLTSLFAGAAIEQSQPLFHFAILSDRTGGHTPGIYPQVIDEIALLHPDFVVTVGDHIEGYGEDYDRSEAEWDSLLALISALDAPIYTTPGNHDIWDETSEGMYVARTGRTPYYSFDHENTHFVILDVARIEYSSDLPEAQKEWLIADLEGHRGAENIFVFYHKPLWVNTLMVGKSDPLHDVFREYGVDAVFNGHLHHYFATEFDGVEYTVIGSSGGAMYRSVEQPVPRGEFFQFGWVTVDRSGHELAIVDLGGIYPRDVVTADALSEIEEIESEMIRIDELRVPDNTSPRVPVNVTIQNASDRIMDDVVKWEIPDGWQVEPREAIVSIEPGQAGALTFLMMNSGDLYPLPRMSCTYPLSNGRTLDIDLPARVIRTAVASRIDSPPVIDGDVSDA
ncbi:MAG: metallophosphoesterase, partial [Candidatus Eisenbacteria bacterium]|nr:metallophosphoesterase [Candidatus Eisenbacteria bacterium]